MISSQKKERSTYLLIQKLMGRIMANKYIFKNGLIKVFDSGMNCVSHQNFCFASLAEMALACSSDQLSKSVRVTLLPCVKWT